MPAVIYAFLGTLSSLFRSRLSLQVEIVALRHQLAVYKRSERRPHLRPADRILWSWLSRHWAAWREALVFVQPATVIAWQRKRFRDHRTRMSQAGKLASPVDRRLTTRYASSSGRSPARIRFGARRALLASWGNSASRWRSQRWTEQPTRLLI